MLNGRPQKEPDIKETPSEPKSRQPSQAASPTLKVVLLGDLGVGKTCLRSQFVHHVFSNAYKATIGGDYLTTTVPVGPEAGEPGKTSDPGEISDRGESGGLSDTGETSDPGELSDPGAPRAVSLQVWDTAGQERYNLISQAFYRGADVAVLVYDVTSYESLLSVRDWFARFMQHCQVESPGIVIVGNKLDRAGDRAVDRLEVQDVLCRNAAVPLAEHVGCWAEDVMEISARTLASVDAVFRRVAVVGLAKMHDRHHHRCAVSPSVVLGDTQAVSSRCAC